MFEAHFQTFEEPEGGVALTARLAALREELARRQLSGFVIPRADQQQNEYVAPSEERLAWLTGFTGSAGLAIVLPKQAAVFVDGRYTLQAAKQVDTQAWTIASLVDPPPESWLTAHLVSGDRLGFDPWLHTSAATERLAAACAKAGASLVPSPHMATSLPLACSSRIRASLFSGVAWARKSSTPASAAIAAAVRGLSPVIITVRMPIWRRAEKRSRMPPLTISFSWMTPSKRL